MCGGGGREGARAPALALLLLALSRAAGTGAAQAACQALEDAYSRNSDGSLRAHREVSIYGRVRRFQVFWDGRAPSRAAAALQLAAMRALMRYTHVDMLELPISPNMSPMCALAGLMAVNCAKMGTLDEFYDNLTLSPAISWSGLRCLQFETCPESTELQPRPAMLGAGAAPATLRLHAHVAAAADARPACALAASLWDFYTDQHRLNDCFFTQTNKPMPALATVYYTLPNRMDVKEFNSSEFINCVAAEGLFLNLSLLKDDGYPRIELFRLLKERKYSFLFIDYDIWDEMPGVYKVQYPPCAINKAIKPMRSIRLADADSLSNAAPQILQGVQRFSPTTKTIREVLEIEASNPKLDIKEAACSWAIEHNATFESWYQTDHELQHSIVVFLCGNDPDKHEYKKLVRAIERIYRGSELNIGSYIIEIDCGDEAQMSNEFIKETSSYRMRRLIGAVGAGAGARAAAALAPGLQTALLLYAAPPAAVRLGAAVRATSGTLHQLVLATQHFLNYFNWTRLALISDESELSKDLSKSFRNNKELRIHDVPFKSSNISDTLQSLQNMNAKIFFVNTNPEAAQIIICAAYRLGLTSTAEYVWILRERRAVDLECGDKTVPYNSNIDHFTISFWWRGGNYTQFESQPIAQKKLNNVLRSTLDDLWPEETWPILAAPLADSLEFLIKSFKKFTQLYPERYYDLHGDGSARLLLDSLVNNQVSGVVQNLEYVNGTLSQPLIFLDRWNGHFRKTAGVWRIKNDQIQLINEKINIYNHPSDGTQFCLTNTSNELFNPRCYDYVWLMALCFIVVASFALYLARRVRLKRLGKRDSLLTAQLMAQREFVSNALADHYVDRAALELYDYLGHGGFGRVRYAILRAPERQPISVAVKELRDDGPLTEESELLREACTLATLCHDHIVRLIGVCATGGPLLVLLEYAFFGNLCEYLCERRHLAERATDFEENDEAYHVSAPSLTRLAREIASALEYLALKRLVHRDIRASNCLVDARRSVKLADFGLARKTGTGAAGEEEYLTRRRGLFPVLWMAPESLERGVFSAASDAWGLGVLLLELVTLGARPYGAWPPQRVLRYVSAGGRPPLPPDVAESTRDILVQCWRRAPEERASAATLAARLRAEPEALRPALRPAAAPDDAACPPDDDDDVTISVAST